MKRLTFAIDQGNTATKCGLFDGHRMVAHRRANRGEESQLIEWIKSSGCASGIVSSVRSDKGLALIQAWEGDVIQMHNDLPLPFEVTYQTPHTLGVDRLANSAGALSIAPNGSALVLDCGSCLTVTYIHAHQLVGGSISPGLHMRLDALAQFTGQLPHVEPSNQPIARIGQTTAESILSGVQLGMLAEIKEIIAHYCSTNEPLNVIMTGGDASYFVPWLKSPIFAEPFLTLMGLHEIYLFQHHSI